MAEKEPIVFQVRQLMKKARSLLLFAKLCWKIHLKKKIKDDTSWSSTYQILLRYVQCRKHVLNFAEVEMDGMLLSSAAKRKVNVMIKKLKNLGEVTKKLQRPHGSNRISRA